MSSGQEYHRVATTTEVQEQGKKRVDVNGHSILICYSRNQFFAIDNMCSHAAKRLHGGRVCKGWIACPVHGARFDLATGKALNLPAVNPIETFEVRVVEDWVEVLV